MKIFWTKHGAMLGLMSCWLVAVFPRIAGSHPISLPGALESQARLSVLDDAERVSPRFLNQPGVIATKVSDESGTTAYIALYGGSGIVAVREPGSVFVARKHRGVWGKWRERAEANWQCGLTDLDQQSMPTIDNDVTTNDVERGGSIRIFTVGFWYTSRFLQAAGGDHDDVVVSVALAAAQLQDALANTSIPSQVGVSVVEQTSYDEGSTADVEDALGWFRPAAGARRLATSSDLFHLLIHGDPFGTIGIANLFNGSASRAFGVTRDLAYGDGETFIHEIGHNLGAGHSPQNGCGTFSDSCGHFISGQVRDFMTYSEHCFSCPVSLMFSSPNLPFAAGGVPVSAPSGIVNQRDNARIVSYAAPRVADFTDSEPPLPVPVAIALGDAVIGPLLEVIFVNGFE